MPEGKDGLPDRAALEAFVASNTDIPVQDKGNAQPIVEPPKQDDAPPVEPDKEPITDLAQFKNPKDLLKSYKEIQSFTTKVSQENKTLKDQLAQMQEALEIQRLQAMPPGQPQQPKKFDEQFIENPEAAIAQTVEQRLTTARVADVLEEEAAKNQGNEEEFLERYQYAMRLRQQYPWLARSPQGVKKLFSLGDRYREAERKRIADAMTRQMFNGDEALIAKFRALVAGQQAADPNNKNAYMPDTSTGIRPDAGKPQNAHEAQISAATEKGDVDGVLKGIFTRQFAAAP